MAAGTGVLGRSILLTLATKAVAGVTTKGISIANEPVDVSDDNANGWREILATAGSQTLDLSLSGITKNLELLQAMFANTTSQLYPCLLTYPDGSTLAFDGFIASLNSTGEYNGAETFDCALQSSGVPVFTAAPAP